MLHEFITSYRDPIILRAREKLTDRPWALVSESELEHGVPLFLTQLSETLRLETTASPFSATAIGESAARHGRELRALGFNISQVVHDYGDICQAITEVAVEQNAADYHRRIPHVESLPRLGHCGGRHGARAHHRGNANDGGDRADRATGSRNPRCPPQRGAGVQYPETRDRGYQRQHQRDAGPQPHEPARPRGQHAGGREDGRQHPAA